MMKTLLFFFFTFCGMSQETLWLNEEFDSTERNWGFWNDSSGMSKCTKGLWHLHSRQNTFYTSTRHYLDPAKDFIMETAIRFNYGDNNNAIGLLFGGSDEHNYNMFAISGNQHYMIATYENGNWTKHLDWGYRDNPIKKVREWNILRIEKKTGKYAFFINGKKIHTTENVMIYGPHIGTINLTLANYSIDYIKVWQDNKINLAGDAKMTDAVKENLGPAVNSIYDEILPQIAPDGKTLYFSRRFAPENSGGTNDADEIYYSVKDSSGNWLKSRNISKPLNNPEANWVISVTPDNQTLLLGNCYDAKGEYSGSGISFARKKAEGWNIPGKVTIANFKNISEYNQFYMSQDSKTLLISAMPEAQFSSGRNDLYVSFLQKDSTWSEPRNLGFGINTTHNESTPFLASDGTTLYFASDGYPGYGDYDIFVTKRLDSTWESWSEPRNLGPAINTVGDDEGFTIPASGDCAFMSSSYKSSGGSDIIRINLPASVRTSAVALVYGKVFDSKSGLPVCATINYNDLRDNTELGLATSDPETGDYKIVLPTGRKYSFLAAREGSYSISENFDLTGLPEYVEIRKDLYLTPIETGAKMRLNNLFFDTGKWELREESYAELSRLIKMMQENPSMNIRIEGHTDDMGKDGDNLALSENRAGSVAGHIISRGIHAGRISFKGYGEKQPARDNDSDENRQYNRRVEFIIESR